MMDEPDDDNDIAYDVTCDQIEDNSTVERLNRLEIQAGFTEDLVDRLDLIITRQQNQIDLLIRELQRLRHDSNAENLPTQHHLRDEQPPHY